MRRIDETETEEAGQPSQTLTGRRIASRIGAFGRLPLQVRMAIGVVLALAALLIVQQVLLALTAESLRLAITPTSGTLAIDGQTLTFALNQTPTSVQFAATDPLTREFQIDGSDSTNNFSLDPAYIARIAGTPYYRFQAWMRNSSSYSSWRDVVTSGGRVSPQSDSSTVVTLADSGATTLSAALLRPETPSHIYLRCDDSLCAEIIIDRNDRYVLAHDLASNGAVSNEQKIYFPESSLPFLAEVLYLLAQVAIWSLLVLQLAFAVYGVALLWVSLVLSEALLEASAAFRASIRRAVSRLAVVTARVARMSRVVARDRWDVLALLTVIGSFAYVLWVALAEYLGQPHILDASAYLFQAKIFASGQLSVPAPANLAAFQGPFMVVRDGRWFAQYSPMTSLLLALGVVLHAPWLVEPVLGTLALWGIYRLGRHFYSGFVAWLAVLLGALSPFYTYLAASYMSHTMALFFAVYFLLMLVRFTRGWRWYDLALAACFAVGLLLTREFSAALIGVVASVFLFGGVWRALWRRRGAVWPAFALAGGIILSGLLLYLLYNRLQTGNALVTPRALFFPGDRYGFGQGIGFYGQHTFAAGMVILDQLLTILMIDLYGWPLYLTLAFLLLAFLRRDTGTRWDVFCGLLLVALVGAQAGYFYHGIYLGPRYLFETLPFLLLLTARGITALASLLSRLAPSSPRGRPVAIGVVVVLLALLLACNLFYYSPRQAQIYADYTGLPAATKVDVRTLYAFHPQQSIIVTGDWYLYNYILWPLNTPALNGATLYAYATSPADLQRLHDEYPGRTLYQVSVAPNGTVSYSQG